ncbi:MAG: hypothetical protein CVU90_16145 [Firmicutes bacterium HGW-Firmicutes-15]|nr:MAG: hypothetical protein CVU90_16145 [Firmicutes bacterium HGW-Firmicutes-15]
MNSQEKVIFLLKILAQAPYEYGVTELGKKIGCGKSGTFKLLSTLVDNGFVKQNVNHKYTLGLAVYLIGKTYEEQIGITHYARPYMEKLRDEVNENVNLGMMVGDVATIVCRVESHQVVRITGKIGDPRPFYASAIGKTLAAYEDTETIKRWYAREPIRALTNMTKTSLEKILSDLAMVRERGYAISDEEFASEAFGIGAPIRDPSGKVWAAISIGAPKIRIDQNKITLFSKLLVETANRMSKDLSVEGATFSLKY